MTVLSLSLLVGVVAIVVDGGSLIEERRHVQATADAAALAAAADLFANFQTNQGIDLQGTAQSSALAIAAANGFSNDGVQSTVTINTSPQTYQGGPNAGKALPPGYVEVIIQYNAGRTFSNVFGSGVIPVLGRAVARGIWGPNSNAVMLLNLRASGALTSTSSGGLLVNGQLLVNSNSSTAISLSGGGTVTASQFNVVKVGSGLSALLLSLLQGPGGTPPTIDYISSVPDPLRHLTDPDPVALGLPLQGTNLQINAGVVNLYPGVYSGGITVSSGATVILHANSNGTPGIYYLQGGGLTVSGPSSVTMAVGETAGVMIYNAWSSGSNAINLSGSGVLTINPPAYGLYKGISIFQKRGTLSAAAPAVTLFGSSAMSLTGTIYAAYAKVTMSGSAGVNIMGGQVIADTLSLSGSALLSINPGTQPIANTRILNLVE